MRADPLAASRMNGGDFENGDKDDEQPTWANGEIIGERGVKDANDEDGEHRGPARFVVGVGARHGDDVSGASSFSLDFRL